MVTFSIVVIAREINDYIREAMPYYLSQTFKDFEIVLVSEKKEKEKFSKTRIINSGRASPAKARNTGVKKAKGEIIAFIDDDAYPEKNWLEKSIVHFKNREIVGVGGPSLVPKKVSFFQKVSNEVYRLSSKKTGMRYGKARKQNVEDWPTCNLFVRKKDFLDCGGFDARYWGAEDNQLCFALTKKGGKITYDPDIIIYHHPRKNLNAHLRQTLFWGMWRGFLVKKYPENSLRLTFFMPSMLVLWLLIGGIVSLFWQTFGYMYIGVFILYLVFLFVTGIRTKSLKLFFPVILLTVISQLIYGIGLLKGLVFGEPTKKTFNPSEKIKITNENK